MGGWFFHRLVERHMGVYYLSEHRGGVCDVCYLMMTQ